jgi:hypothetical protein
MQMLFVLIVVALMMLGVVSLWDMSVKSFKSQSDTKEPLNYEGVVEAIGEGLVGADLPVEHSGSVFGRMVEAIAHALGHLFQH